MKTIVSCDYISSSCISWKNVRMTLSGGIFWGCFNMFKFFMLMNSTFV